MPRAPALRDAQPVLLVNVAARSATEEQVTATVAEAIRRGRPGQRAARVLAVTAGQVVAAFERLDDVSARPAGVNVTLDGASDPQLCALVGSLVPAQYRWRRGQRTLFRYADPRVLGLAPYPSARVGDVGRWTVHTDGTDLLVSFAGDVHVVQVHTHRGRTSVRLRSVQVAPVDGTEPPEDPAVDEADDPDRARADFEAELAAIRASIGAGG